MKRNGMENKNGRGLRRKGERDLERRPVWVQGTTQVSSVFTPALGWMFFL